MLFSRIAGQQVAKQGLLRMMQRNQLPHALLLTGHEGTGGLPMSLALAQYIFCTNKTGNDSCGVCASCGKIQKLEHADLHLSFPAISPKPGTKALSRHYIQEFREFVSQTPYGTTFEWLQHINAENKQGNIPAEECRSIIENLNLKSYEGGSKIQIIWRPEYLGKEGNILLKLIEEPPADTYLILVAENTEAILPTILSRTQIIRLAPLSATDIATALTERDLADERKAMQTGHLAGGSFTEALRILRDTENDLFPDVRNWFNGIFTNNGLMIAGFVEERAKEGREQQKNFLRYVIQLLEQTLRCTWLPQVPLPLPPEEAQFVQRLAARGLPGDTIRQMVKAITDTIYHIERNAHAKTQLHALSIRLVHIIQGRSEMIPAS